MSRSFALLTLAAFALSAPINARTLPGSDAADESPATAGVSFEISPPECPQDSAKIGAAADATGALPGGATAATCCWIYWLGRWWCMAC